MAGRISGERRREIRAIEIARRRTQRAKAGIAMRIGIAIAEASRPCVRHRRVEHGDVHNRHRPPGTPRSELFTKNAVLSRSDRSVIKAAGIDRDPVPTVERIKPLPWADKRRDVASLVKQRTKCRIKSVIQNGGES